MPFIGHPDRPQQFFGNIFGAHGAQHHFYLLYRRVKFLIDGVEWTQ